MLLRYVLLPLGLTLACVSLVATLKRAGNASPDTELRFVRDGRLVKSVDLAALKRSCEVRSVELDDPYYGRRMTFLGFPFKQVLAQGFGEPAEALRDKDFVLRARDGYAKPTSGALLDEDGAFLVFADAKRAHDDDPGFEPIDRRQVDPAPYYLVWTQPGQLDTHRYPWPYQLTSIEIASLPDLYPHTVPRSAAPDSPAWKGYATFRSECISCHAINGEGGKVGPDLNVPRSIVEYRPIEQIKQYIRDPESFRHTSMPEHRYLSAAQLDQLVAYFETMRSLKYDPGSPR
jgi:mono/diheme cytochrome c family protein